MSVATKIEPVKTTIARHGILGKIRAERNETLIKLASALTEKEIREAIFSFYLGLEFTEDPDEIRSIAADMDLLCDVLKVATGEVFIYREEVLASGRKIVKVFVSETKSWKVVGRNAAISVIAKGHGKMILGKENNG